MNKCKRCKIEIMDDSIVCPLCNGVLERTSDDTSEKSAMYPDVEPAIRKTRFLIKLAIFSSIVVETGLCIINYLTWNGLRWSLICGLGLGYICFTLIYTMYYNRGHRRKIMWQAVIMEILLVLADCIAGFQGWSVTFAVPSIVMLIDLAIFVLMLVNLKNFQSYLMMLVYNTIFSVIVLVIVLVTNVISFNLLNIIAAGFSGILLLGTLIFGDKKAINELNRRFRV